MAIRCEVYDDDNGSMLNPPLPKLPDVSTMVSAYAPAYVLPVFDVGDNNLSVPFILNAIDIQDAYDWDSRSQNTTTFWVAYLLTAYQPYAVDDGDPNSEFSPLGLTPSQEGGSLILLELHQLHEGIADPTTEERDTVVHESGHSAGDDTPADPDHAELGIMTEGAPITQSSFSASTLRRFREANPW
jgi:hypothetical protein